MIKCCTIGTGAHAYVLVAVSAEIAERCEVHEICNLCQSQVWIVQMLFENGIVCLSIYDMTLPPVIRFTVADRYFSLTWSCLAYQLTSRWVDDVPSESRRISSPTMNPARSEIFSTPIFSEWNSNSLFVHFRTFKIRQMWNPDTMQRILLVKFLYLQETR